jgi:hypothetical protein
MDFGLHQCQTDQKVFHLHIIVGYIILVVYVNGLVIAGSGLWQNHQTEPVFTATLSHQRSR